VTAWVSLVMYDILPHIGDTGVNQALAGAPRETEWTPLLTGPIVPDASTIPTGLTPTVLYNLSYDPCRPEMSTPTPGVNWQGANCADPTGGTNVQNTWYTQGQITDWSTVKSFKILLWPGERTVAKAWQGGTTLLFDAPMKAPLSAPASTFSPLNLSATWNSIGHQEYRLNADGTRAFLQAAAPRKVGVIVPFVVPPAVSVGDYVWMDTNGDGVQGAAAVEPPIKDVVVTLYAVNQDGSRGAWQASTVTNANGYYSFVNLVPDTDYIIEFTKPTGMSFTIQNAGGDSSNSRDGDLTDSDADPATGQVKFNSGPEGNNLVGGPSIANAVTDNPGIDAGFVTPKMNLQLQKSGGTWTGLLAPGTEVTWTLTPNNAGTTDAIAGWSVTDRIPTGMEIVSMSGQGYSCDITTSPTDPVCVSTDNGLAAGTIGKPITVVTKVSAGWTGSSFRNVAYVDKAPTDVTETVPLGTTPPARDTDIANPVTSTDNDAQAVINVVSVGDYVWWDTNRDGLQGAPDVEAPVANLKVTLYAADGTTVLGTTTTAGERLLRVHRAEAVHGIRDRVRQVQRGGGLVHDPERGWEHVQLEGDGSDRFGCCSG
jgi:uncharacterized repeat protein (TIGR01451 family)